ncbi:nucleotidyltransferase family protein [uncultured Draconibacterium sp.]|uniref:nucleotidyltransferase family protein n=1 Tax=uncultured Draconibacterium sp. TaxID=1573823 RepID=UPI0025E0B254|nr:nucleotidyltransferase family protein [uncultured Draconibacterium sp.]
MSQNTNKIAGLILAAGASKRCGTPKQLLPFKGTTLLNYTKKQLSKSLVDSTFVILGANASEIVKKSGLKEPEIIVFNEWEQGMGASLAYACQTILSKEEFDGILITLTDLPLVGAEHYQKMLQNFTEKEDIVATKASSVVGVPALFGASYFKCLSRLKGSVGAKSILQKNTKHLKTIANKNAGVDIDTMEDYQKLLLTMDHKSSYS